MIHLYSLYQETAPDTKFHTRLTEVINWSIVTWATHYRIYEWAILVWSAAHPTNTITITSPSPWAHTYVIKTYNWSCESSWTSVTFTTQNCSLLAPTPFTIWDAYWATYQCWSPILSRWAVAWATSYDILQWWIFISNTNSLSYTVASYPVWSSVTYWVRAKNATWCVSPTSTVTVNTWNCAAWSFYMSSESCCRHIMFVVQSISNIICLQHDSDDIECLI